MTLENQLIDISRNIAAQQNVVALQYAALQSRDMQCSVEIVTHVNGHKCRGIQYEPLLEEYLAEREYGNYTVRVLRLTLNAKSINNVTHFIDDSENVVGNIEFACQGKRTYVNFNPLLIATINVGTFDESDKPVGITQLPHINYLPIAVGQELIHFGYAVDAEEAAVLMFGDDETIAEYKKDQAKKPVGLKVVSSDDPMDGFSEDLPRPTTGFVPKLVQ